MKDIRNEDLKTKISEESIDCLLNIPICRHCQAIFVRFGPANSPACRQVTISADQVRGDTLVARFRKMNGGQSLGCSWSAHGFKAHVSPTAVVHCFKRLLEPSTKSSPLIIPPDCSFGHQACNALSTAA